ncbi:formate/nitrite transporter family protein [Pseudokineococcus basanitobsidens]|uniref:Formate/nitrite transporter family protein n=1 Tax=Pseudokineococcus basanitobsidens TaxID=1926649 RepID=A0ABU8RGV8_9ACTN
MSDAQARADLGDSDEAIEDDLSEAVDAIVDDGAQRLHRTWRELLITGFFGGLEVGLGVLALLAVYDATGSHLLAGLAFGIGFLALMLGHSELFTEGFLVPVTAVAGGHGSVSQLIKLWGGTFVANLLGGFLFMALAMTAFPGLRATTVEMGAHFVQMPLGLESAVLAVLAGSTITLMTRMQQGADGEVGKIAASFAGGFLLAGLQMAHSVLDSLLAFGALIAGAPFGYLDWLGWVVPTALFNMVGGLVLVTGLRLLRSKQSIGQEREEAGQPARPRPVRRAQEAAGADGGRDPERE